MFLNKIKYECRLQRLPEYHWQLLRVRQPGSHAEVVGRGRLYLVTCVKKKKNSYTFFLETQKAHGKTADTQLSRELIRKLAVCRSSCAPSEQGATLHKSVYALACRVVENPAQLFRPTWRTRRSWSGLIGTRVAAFGFRLVFEQLCLWAVNYKMLQQVATAWPWTGVWKSHVFQGGDKPQQWLSTGGPDETPYDREAVSSAARRAETKWNLPLPSTTSVVKETSPGLFLTSQQKKTIFCSWYFPGVDTCNSPWKHFPTLRGFLKDEFPQRLSSRSQSDLGIFKSFAINRGGKPWLTGDKPLRCQPARNNGLSFMLALCLHSSLSPSPLASPVPLFPSWQSGV